MFSIRYMTPKVRRQALLHHLRTKLGGDRSRLIAKLQLTEGRVSQALTDGFGERAARAYETRLGLKRGALDREEEGGTVAVEEATAYNATEEPVDWMKEGTQLLNDWMLLDAADRMQFRADVAVAALKVKAKTGGSTYVEDGTPSVEKFAREPRPTRPKSGS